jgi:hypothetical protein
MNPVWGTEQSFNATLKLYKPISITKNKDLIFPAKVLTGADETVVVSTGDTGAADFTAFGGKNRSVIRTVLESSLILTAQSSSSNIVVDNFIVTGPAMFNDSGKAESLRVGATARILSDSEDGDYAGVGTFRVVYQ